MAQSLLVSPIIARVAEFHSELPIFIMDSASIFGLSYWLHPPNHPLPVIVRLRRHRRIFTPEMEMALDRLPPPIPTP